MANMMTETVDASLFHFDKEKHLYTLRRGSTILRLPSVSEVILDNGLTDARWFDETSRSRGSVVHTVLAGYARGLMFDWAMLDEDLHGYVRSGMRLLDFLKAQVLETEIPRYHPNWLYAGTADIILARQGSEIVADWKTGDMPNTTDYQVWAYDMLQPIRKARQHWGIKLHKDGAIATIHELDDDRYAGDRFLNLLATTRERQKHGVSKIPTDMPIAI